MSDTACQTPLFIGFLRQEYQSGQPFPSPGDLPDPEIEPVSSALQQILYHLSHREALMPIVSFSLMRFNKENASLGPSGVFTYLGKGHC